VAPCATTLATCLCTPCGRTPALIAGDVVVHEFDPRDGVLELELTAARGVTELVWPVTWDDVDVEADGAVVIADSVIAWQPDPSRDTHRLVARRR